MKHKEICIHNAYGVNSCSFVLNFRLILNNFKHLLKKTQTDVIMNNYIGLLFISTLLPSKTICKSFFDMLTYQNVYIN